MVIQSTSPYFAPRSFWSVDATLKEAGLHTWPYHAYVPSFGDWGFILAGKRRDYTPADKITVPARYLDSATLRELFHFPADMPALAMPPNRLNEQSSCATSTKTGARSSADAAPRVPAGRDRRGRHRRRHRLLRARIVETPARSAIPACRPAMRCATAPRCPSPRTRAPAAWRSWVPASPACPAPGNWRARPCRFRRGGGAGIRRQRRRRHRTAWTIRRARTTCPCPRANRPTCARCWPTSA